MNELYTREEVAKLLKVSTSTIYRWEEQGRLKLEKQIGFKKSEVEDIAKIYQKFKPHLKKHIEKKEVT